jgi:hypothetical protein
LKSIIFLKSDHWPKWSIQQSRSIAGADEAVSRYSAGRQQVPLDEIDNEKDPASVKPAAKATVPHFAAGLNRG